MKSISMKSINTNTVLALVALLMCQAPMLAQSAAQFNEQGLSLYESGHPREAIPYFDKGIAADPTVPSLYMNRGSAYDDLGEPQRAMQDYTKAISLNPRMGAAYFNRALAYSRMRKWEETIKDVTEDLRLRPAHVQGYLLRAAAYSSIGKKAEAQADYNKVLEFDPENKLALQYKNGAPGPEKPSAETLQLLSDSIARSPNTTNLQKRAQIYFAQQQYDKALEDINRVIGLNPSIWEAHLLRSGCHMALKQDDAALKDLNETLKLKPDQPNALLGRGTLFLRMNQAANAVPDLEALAKQQPKSAAAFLNLGYAYLLKQDFEKSIEAFTRAKDINASDPNAYLGRAKAGIGLKKYKFACEDLDQALLLRPSLSEAQRLRGLARTLADPNSAQPEKALADYNAVESNRLTDTDYILRGYLNKRTGNLEDALKDCDKAIAMNPTALAYFERANVYVSLGQDNKAASDLEASSKMNPKDERAAAMLAVIYLKQGKFEQATKLFDPFITADSDSSSFQFKGLAAAAYAAAGKTDTAIRLLDQAIASQQPGQAAYRGLRAECYLRNHQTEKALIDVNKAIELDPDKQPAAYRIRASIAALKNDWPAALKDLDTAVTLAPKDPTILSFRAIANERLGNADKALADADKALELSPNNENALRARSAINETKAPEKSVEDLSKLIEMHPNDPQLYMARGSAYTQCDQYKKAMDDAESGLKIAQDNLGLHILRLNMLIKANDIAAANKEINAVEALKPTGDSRFTVGIAKLETGQFESAAQDFANAPKESEWKSPLSPYGVILSYLTEMRLGNADKARQFIKDAATHYTAVDKWPNPIISHFNGQMNREKLMDSATDNDKKTEVMTYLAMHDAVDKQNDEAIKNLRWVVQNGNKHFTEYDLSLYELSRLDPSFAVKRGDVP